MTLNGSLRPDVAAILKKLKDFQKNTVEYIFQRLYLDQDPASRFLIADEVGLGKTLVARGVIAKSVNYLWETIDRIDVLYICSNQEIARQNIDRLNITADRKFQLASRATLLPITLHQLRGNKLNFVSFTPGTSFHLHSTSGVAKERWVLYRLLMDLWDVHEPTFRNIMRAGVQKGNFKPLINWYNENEEIDEELAQAFFKEIQEEPELYKTYLELADWIGYRRRYIPPEARWARDKWIGKLRKILARSSLAALEPDIVILDEFQRFKYLLDDDSPVALLAREVFEFPEVKILLLSATPYKMYSLAWERDDDHYADFYRTARFLLQGDEAMMKQLEQAVQAYRDAYMTIHAGGGERIAQAKSQIEAILGQIMVRTERLAASEDRNGMLKEKCIGFDAIRSTDFLAFKHLDHIARAMDAGDQVEYWKSTAYPLNLMEGYKVKQQLKSVLEEGSVRPLSQDLKDARPYLLTWKDIRKYELIDPQNARLRSLFQESLESGNWKLLWLPPSLPYYRDGKGFKDVSIAGYTKTLIFSSWRVVPKVIAILASYEAERRIQEKVERDFRYDDLSRKRRPLLNFNRSKGRLVGMPIFCLTYPSWSLANTIDPLILSLDLRDGKLPTEKSVFGRARQIIKPKLDSVMSEWPTEETRVVDSRWYWAAPLIMDWIDNRDLLESWWNTGNTESNWALMLSDDEQDETEQESRYSEHITEFRDLVIQQLPLGKQPHDLLDVLTRIALAAPATTTLRALLRIIQPSSTEDRVGLIASAAKAGLGYRSLFNQPDAIMLLNQLHRSGAYWEKVLRYCQGGNLQAVMDEYIHGLYEGLGLMGHASSESAMKIAETILKAVSLRAAPLAFDEIVEDRPGHFALEQHRIRCRYALRFGDEKSEGVEDWTRSADVRIAFNSPFRPFVLATTSIGQEGLDFHQYCHRVMHWNLPSNPVDLEQREGRVHRYKGHVIRRNIAKHYGLQALQEHLASLGDPWKILFEQACADRPEDANDLVPFWIFDTKDGHKIERRIPILPLSREVGELKWLKKTLVAYRSVIGQPRQEELVAFLLKYLDPEEYQEFVSKVSIDLSPPSIS
jgi:hypothetical protein